MTTLSATVKSIEKPGDEYQVRIEFEKPVAFLTVTKEEAQALVDRIGTMIEVKVDIGLPETKDTAPKVYAVYDTEGAGYLRGHSRGWTWNEIVPDDLWTGSIDEAQELVEIGDGDEVVVEVQKVNGAWVLV